MTTPRPRPGRILTPAPPAKRTPEGDALREVAAALERIAAALERLAPPGTDGGAPTMTTPAYADRDDPRNGPDYQTGRKCIEGCGRPAGTAWSPLWCFECNAERMDRIDRSLRAIASSRGDVSDDSP